MNKSDLEPILKQRGIYAIAKRAGWRATHREGHPAWVYPTFNEDGSPHKAKRIKWAPGHEPKYKWDPPGLDERPSYYLLPGTLDAIGHHDGILHLVAGEPDNLTLRASGKANVTNWFGENQVPATLADDLTRWGVRQVYYYYDLDDAGEAAAKKVEEALQGSDVMLAVRQLPGAKPAGYDLNACWVECAFDAGVFHAILEASEPVSFFDPPPDKPEPLPDTAPDRLDQVAERVYAEIAQHLEKRGTRDHVYECPLDHGPDGKDFYFDPDSGKIGGCQGKHAGELTRWRDLADLLGIDVSEIARQVRHDAVQTSAPPDKPEPDRVQVPRVLIVRSDDALDRVARFANGLELPAIEPFLAPYEPLRLFGGSSHLWPPTKNALVIADTGFGKTSFVETIGDWSNIGGIDVYMRGQEWTPEDYQMRKISAWGGPSYEAQQLNELWHLETKRGVRDKHGVKFTGQELGEYNRVVDRLKLWKGKTHHLVTGTASVSHMLEEASRDIFNLRRQGRRVLIAIWDYAQKELQGNKGWAELELIFNEIAMWGIDEHIFNILVSQVNKGAGDKVRRYGQTLSGEDAQMLTPKQAQVAWTLNPVFNSHGERVEEADIVCVKNSNAPYPARLRVKTALNRHRWRNEVLSRVVRHVRTADDADGAVPLSEDLPEPAPLDLQGF